MKAATGTWIIMYALLFLGLYVFMIRPQKKRVQQAQNMLKELQVGDTIVTIGGLYGVISEIDEAAGTIVIDCDGVYLTFDRRAVRQVIEKKATEKTTSVEDLRPEEPVDAEEAREEKTPAPEEGHSSANDDHEAN